MTKAQPFFDVTTNEEHNTVSYHCHFCARHIGTWGSVTVLQKKVIPICECVGSYGEAMRRAGISPIRCA